MLPRRITSSGIGRWRSSVDRGAKLPTGRGAGAGLAEVIGIVPEHTYRTTAKTGLALVNRLFYAT